ncbi:MAG: hypothetical protein JWO78_1776 [Micavibrio sp.]|nr:hypothetical protein [Micavibrio sp.]
MTILEGRGFTGSGNAKAPSYAAQKPAYKGLIV